MGGINLGGGDAQLAFGLVAMGADGWILGYLFGGTILLGLGLMVYQRGILGAGRRIRQVIGKIRTPDEEAIRIPWAIIAGISGMIYIWIWLGRFWQF